MADAYRSGLSAVEPISMSDAAGILGAGRASQEEKPANQPERAPPEDASAPEAPEVHEPPADDGPAQDDPPQGEGEENAAADENQPPGDDNEQTTEEADPADDLPPVEPPRSWTKAEKEAFAALPRAHQESLLARDQTREREIRKRQDEVATASKTLQSQWQAAEQARAQYEQGVQQVSAQLAAVITNDFADIKTYDDVVKLARDDPYRHGQYQAAVQRAQAFQQEQNRLSSENQQRANVALQQFNAAETAKFLERAPEFADPKQGPQLSAEVDAMLVDDYGLEREELSRLWSGAPISALDSRFKLLLRDALLYKRSKASLKPKPNPAPKPASPPPQRPGTPPAKGEVVNRTLEKANAELSRTGSRESALALIKARRRA